MFLQQPTNWRAKMSSKVISTKPISVSVSAEFQKILQDYELSPTEVFRRGIAVCLHDLDVSPYAISDLNKSRSDYVKKFMETIEKNKRVLAVFDDIRTFANALEEYREENKTLTKTEAKK